MMCIYFNISAKVIYTYKYLFSKAINSMEKFNCETKLRENIKIRAELLSRRGHDRFVYLA